MTDFGARQGLRDEFVLCGCLFGVGPWHQRINVLVEMAVRQFREQVFHVGIGFDAIHFAGTDQACKARPVPAAFIMASEQGVATIHCWAAYGIFDEVGIDVDAAIVKEEPEAVQRQPPWPVATTTLAGGAERKTGMPVWRAAPPA